MLAPGAIALALPYTEALAGLLAVTFILAVRRTGATIWYAVPIGVLGGLVRPTGVLLAVVPVIELVVSRRRSDVRVLVAAAFAPLVGSALYCGWAYLSLGRAWLPYTAQTHRGLRGGVLADPVHGLLNPPAGAGLGPTADVVAAGVALLLLAVAWRIVPRSVWAWTALGVVAALTSTHAMSLPRYLSAEFPLLVALAAVLRARWTAALVTAGSTAVFCVVGLMAFAGTGVL